VKVLIADDDADLRELIAFSLSQAGYLVIKAGDGHAAVRRFEEEAPDLVVLDVNMPGLSGFQACEAIRRSSRVPVMMLTVRGEEEDLVRALGLGADDYLTKPFSPRTLLARIKALLRRAGMEPSAALATGRVALDLEEHTVRIGAGEAVRLTKLELRVNHFIAVARPSPSDVKKEETLPLIAEKLADPRFAQIVEQRAKEERGQIEQEVAQKRDPARMKNEIACGAVAFLRANKKTGQNGDYLTASCAALAAITLAQINDANAFVKEVRRVEGLPESPLGAASAWR